MALTEQDGKNLIKLARQAISSKLLNEKPPILDKKFSEPRGCFVTLKINSNLRGCIGYPEPIAPLNKAIYDSALNAALQDPRFPALTKQELSKIHIEITVLTKPELINTKPEEYPFHIKIGEDGLILRGPNGSGLLLPQVFTEYNCTPKSALEMLCQKAGLPTNAWLSSENKIYKFQGQIFEE